MQTVVVPLCPNHYDSDMFSEHPASCLGAVTTAVRSLWAGHWSAYIPASAVLLPFGLPCSALGYQVFKSGVPADQTAVTSNLLQVATKAQHSPLLLSITSYNSADALPKSRDPLVARLFNSRVCHLV
jgi:hypothetical protein